MLGLGNSLTSGFTSYAGDTTVYSPANVQNGKLQWWFKNNGTDNPAVGEWNGSDANSRIINQGVSAKQPTVTYTSPGFVNFDGVNDFYRVADNSDEVLVAANRSATFMLVYKLNSLDANMSILSGGQGNSTKFSFPANDRFSITTETQQQLFVASTGTPFTTSGIKILFISRNNSGEVNLHTHGGGELASFPLNQGASSNTTSNTEIKLRQMSGDDNDGLNSFKGRVHEVAIWQSLKLTQQEMENIYESYLFPKYSV
tara:strand:- start:306 stop:1076 length:771 start_codon:yes stop_codon:yes gene_type:complete